MTLIAITIVLAAIYLRNDNTMPVTLAPGAPPRVTQKLIEYAKTIHITSAGGISLAREQIIMAGEVALLFGGTLGMDALLDQCRHYAERNEQDTHAAQMIEMTWQGHIPEWGQAKKNPG